MSGCVFCGSTARTTREHLWPAWLRSLLRDAKIVARHGRTSTRPGYDKTWAAPPFTLTVKGICAACNNGWMSELEEAAKPLLAPLILGQAARLDRDAQKLVATWTTKTAMVYQLTTRHTAIQPHRFHALRLHRRPPAGVQVWLGARSAAESQPSLFGFRTSALAPASEREPRYHAFLVTLAIGHWIGQIYGNDLPFDSYWARRGDAAAGLCQIWPPAITIVAFPPPLPFRTIEPLAEDHDFEQELTRLFAARNVELRIKTG